jgi:hypothetical protein
MPGFEVFRFETVKRWVNNPLNEADEYQQSTVGHYLELKKHIHQIRVTPWQWCSLRKRGNILAVRMEPSLYSVFV